MNSSVKNTLIAGATLAVVGSLVSAVVYNTTTSESVAHASAPRTCNLRSLKGTYSFDATGFAPALPPGLLQDENGVALNTDVDFSDSSLTVIPLHAIGHVEFDGNGAHKGYIHENVGGAFEDNVPFTGTYTIEPGPNNVGCTGTWILQDDHRFFPFSEEGPHSFKVTLAPESKGFHYIHIALNGAGQATLSGWAPLAYK